MKPHQFKWQLANLAGRCSPAAVENLNSNYKWLNPDTHGDGTPQLSPEAIAEESVKVAKAILAKCGNEPVPAFVPDPADAAKESA